MNIKNYLTVDTRKAFSEEALNIIEKYYTDYSIDSIDPQVLMYCWKEFKPQNQSLRQLEVTYQDVYELSNGNVLVYMQVTKIPFSLKDELKKNGSVILSDKFGLFEVTLLENGQLRFDTTNDIQDLEYPEDIKEVLDHVYYSLELEGKIGLKAFNIYTKL